MFTGIVQAVGEITNLQVSDEGGIIEVSGDANMDWSPIGASIAVDGVCLTLRKQVSPVLCFDVLGETISRTSLGRKKVGSLVNMEAALKVGDRLGGHWVTGHVDGIGAVRAIEAVGRDRAITISCPADLTRFMVTKGSVCCDGISLTLVDVSDSHFTVHVIPHTWENTAWRELKVGSVVNIETDFIGKYVFKFLQTSCSGVVTKDQGSITWERLRAMGFEK